MSKHSVTITLGKHWTRVSLSLEFIIGAYSSSPSGFKAWLSNWNSHVALVSPVPVQAYRNYRVKFVHISSSIKKAVPYGLEGTDSISPVNSSRIPLNQSKWNASLSPLLASNCQPYVENIAKQASEYKDPFCGDLIRWSFHWRCSNFLSSYFPYIKRVVNYEESRWIKYASNIPNRNFNHSHQTKPVSLLIWLQATSVIGLQADFKLGLR